LTKHSGKQASEREAGFFGKLFRFKSRLVIMSKIAMLCHYQFSNIKNPTMFQFYDENHNFLVCKAICDATERQKEQSKQNTRGAAQPIFN
jgi:hypothetical protein